jgi:heme/copper-type cytochrome/quinol oxidase subunit 2
LREGQSFDISFTANQAGTFKVYCDIFCSIHPLMQNGLLNVTAL